MRRLLVLWLPVVVYMAAIFYVSSLPEPPTPPGGDKSWHLMSYLGLGVVTVRAVAGGLGVRIDRGAAVRGMAIAIGYGATDEFHQAFVPERTAQLGDFFADATGVVIGACLCWLLGWVCHRTQNANRSANL